MIVTCTACRHSAEMQSPWYECPKCRSRLYSVSKSGRGHSTSNVLPSRRENYFFPVILSGLLICAVFAGGVVLWYLLTPVSRDQSIVLAGDENEVTRIEESSRSPIFNGKRGSKEAIGGATNNFKTYEDDFRPAPNSDRETSETVNSGVLEDNRDTHAQKFFAKEEVDRLKNPMSPVSENKVRELPKKNKKN